MDAPVNAEAAIALLTDVGPLAPGTFDLRVLEQDQVWTDVHGAVHRLSDISAAHAANIIAHLHNGAPRLQRRLELDHALDADRIDLNSVVTWPAQIPGMTVDPHSWLNAKPLIHALRAIAAPADRPGPEESPA